MCSYLCAYYAQLINQLFSLSSIRTFILIATIILDYYLCNFIKFICSNSFNITLFFIFASNSPAVSAISFFIFQTIVISIVFQCATLIYAGTIFFLLFIIGAIAAIVFIFFFSAIIYLFIFLIFVSIYSSFFYFVVSEVFCSLSSNCALE